MVTFESVELEEGLQQKGYIRKSEIVERYSEDIYYEIRDRLNFKELVGKSESVLYNPDYAVTCIGRVDKNFLATIAADSTVIHYSKSNDEVDVIEGKGFDVNKDLNWKGFYSEDYENGDQYIFIYFL